MSRNGTILLVDDEAYVRESLAAVLERRDFEVRQAASAEEALDHHEVDGIDVVVTDLRMAGGDGLALLARIREEAPDLPVIVLTGHGTVASAVECMRAGAEEYLLKPVDPDALVLVVQRSLRAAGRRRELAYLRTGPDGSSRDRLLGESPAWKAVLDEVTLAAGSDAPVLIQGESGTGKEEVARFLHERSERRDGPLVCVNCAAIPLELFESEFFGHRKGAFTGAVEDRVGRWKVADHGTIFLDEINSLPPSAQPKVLRALQDGAFERVGDSRPTSADVRVVCASNVDLAAEVEAHRFRRDLFYRINVLTLHIPPLRERPGDVEVLGKAFLEEFAARNARAIRGLDSATRDALARYSWPGNVRELRNVIERGVLIESGDVLRVTSLPADVAGAERDPAFNPDSVPDDGDLNLRRHLRSLEKHLIEEALRRSDGVRRGASRLLGIDERNLSYYLRKHGIRD